MSALAVLISAAMLGSSPQASMLAPAPPGPAPYRADHLERRPAGASWSGVDARVLEARLTPGAVLAVPRDAAAVAWRRGGSPLAGAAVEGTIRVVRGPGKSRVDRSWTGDVRLRAAGGAWRLAERQTFRLLDGGVEPGAVLPRDVHRLLVVTPETWSSPEGVARRFERGAGGWRSEGPAFPAAMGRDGTAWEHGLQGDHPRGPSRRGSPRRLAPAGVFLARSVGGTIFLSAAAREDEVAHVVVTPAGEAGAGFDVGVPPDQHAALVAWVAQEERPRKDQPTVDVVTIAAVAVLPREVYREVAALWGLPPLD